MTHSTIRTLVLHRSLLRPQLLAGGERTLVMLNLTTIAILLLGVGFNWMSVLMASVLATLGMWGLQQSAKADPQMSSVYLRHLRYRAFYPAQSDATLAGKPIQAALASSKLSI